MDASNLKWSSHTAPLFIPFSMQPQSNFISHAFEWHTSSLVENIFYGEHNSLVEQVVWTRVSVQTSTSGPTRLVWFWQMRLAVYACFHSTHQRCASTLLKPPTCSTLKALVYCDRLGVSLLHLSHRNLGRGHYLRGTEISRFGRVQRMLWLQEPTVSNLSQDSRFSQATG